MNKLKDWQKKIILGIAGYGQSEDYNLTYKEFKKKYKFKRKK